jgi:4-carboxymuconolactone decarboxylase
MTGNDKLVGPFNPLPYSQEGGTGFLDSVIQALQNGEPAKELTNKERLAQTYTLRLTSEHSVDATLYERAEHAFGRQGLVDIALLIGRYLTICTLLNGFDIPRP